MKQLKLPKGKSVRVFWVDSSTLPGWQSHNAGSMGHVISLGFVTKSDPHCLTLSTSIAAHGDVITPLSIPWKAIISIEKLEKSWDRNSLEGLKEMVQEKAA